MKSNFKIITILTLISLLLSNYTYGQCNLSDWQALQTLYASTDGANWTNNTGWNQVDPAINPTAPPSNCDLGTLHGILLDGSGQVVEINLSNNNLQGNIPSELGDLTNLTALKEQSAPTFPFPPCPFRVTPRTLPWEGPMETVRFGTSRTGSPKHRHSRVLPAVARPATTFQSHGRMPISRSRNALLFVCEAFVDLQERHDILHVPQVRRR